MSARAALRAATAAQHGRVDRIFSALDLAAAPDYRRFLSAQAAAYLPVERALDEAGAATLPIGWAERRRGALLRADLADLGAAEPEPIAPPALPGPAAMLGAIYVLEGSRLGGAVLRRALPATAPQRFLGTGPEPGSWRKLLEKLDLFLYRTDLLEAAAEAAREVFGRFEAGGLRYLEIGKS